MGESRQTFNIWNKYGRRSFFSSLKRNFWYGLTNEYFWTDSFVYPVGKVVCKFFGHDKNYFITSDDEKVCRRCWKIVK